VGQCWVEAIVWGDLIVGQLLDGGNSVRQCLGVTESGAMVGW
jgi:hypothetical protein